MPSLERPVHVVAERELITQNCEWKKKKKKKEEEEEENKKKFTGMAPSWAEMYRLLCWDWMQGGMRASAKKPAATSRADPQKWTFVVGVVMVF